MGRSPCSQEGLNKGTWTAQEDKLLTDYIKAHGEGKWAKVHRDTGQILMDSFTSLTASFLALLQTLEIVEKSQVAVGRKP